jgi:peptide/nickel transport system substrate-binding protein
LNRTFRRAISTAVVGIIVVILVVAIAAGAYLATSRSASTITVTGNGSTVTSLVSGAGSTITTTAAGGGATVTTTAAGIGTTVTTTAAGGSATSTSSPGTVTEGVVGPEWGTQNVGDDVQCGWDTESMWYNDNYEQLVQFAPSDLAMGTYVPVPWLASNYTLASNGTTMVFNLNQGVKFHSGNTMTSADVVYSFYRFLFATNDSSNFLNCPGSGLSDAALFGSMHSVVANGPNQVILTLNYPDPNILTELANQGFSVLDSKLLESHTVTSGTGANMTSDWGFAWLDAGTGGDAGTGPYMLTSFTYEQRAELQTFSGYWGGPSGNFSSNVKTLIFIPYADATTAQFALQQGQVNLIQDAGTTVINSVTGTSGISTNTSPAYLFFYLWFHPVGPLANWEVREAVKEALNYTAISEAVTNGYAKSDASFFPIGTPGYNATFAGAYAAAGPNVTGAKALLAKAGYPNGFSVNIYTRPSSRYGVTFVNLAEVLQTDLAAIGITTTLQVYVVGQFYDLAENTSLPGIWTVPGSVAAPIPVDWALDYAAFGPQNSTYFNWSPSTETGPGVPFSQMETLLNETQTAPNAATATADLTQLDQLYQTYGPSICILQLPNTIAYQSSIKGLVWNSVDDGFIPGLST